MVFDNLVYKKQNSFFDDNISSILEKINHTFNIQQYDKINPVFSLKRNDSDTFSNVELPKLNLLSFEGTRFYIKERISIQVLLNSLDSKSVIEVNLNQLKYNTKGSISHIDPLFFSQSFHFIKILESSLEDIIDYLTYLSLSTIFIDEKLESTFQLFFSGAFSAELSYIDKFLETFEFISKEFYVPCISDSIYLRKIFIKSYGTKFIIDHNEQNKYTAKQIIPLLRSVFYFNDIFFASDTKQGEYKLNLVNLSRNEPDSFLELINKGLILRNF